MASSAPNAAAATAASAPTTKKKEKAVVEPLYPFELKAGEGSVVCEEAILKGKVEVGENTILHPYASLLDHAGGGIKIGQYCIVEEGAIIENHSTKEMVIGDDNVFEIQAWVQAPNVGKGNTFGARSTVTEDISVSDHCVIGEASTVSPSSPSKTTLPPYTVVFGPAAERRQWSGQGQDQEWAARRKEIANLKDVLPRFNRILKTQVSPASA